MGIDNVQTQRQHMLEIFSQIDVDFFKKMSIIRVGGIDYAHSI